jgi:type I restriction enzyme, S subunit
MPQVEIAEALEFARNGASIKQVENAGGIPITRIETIWNSTIDSERFGYADLVDAEQHKNHLLEYGDILMSHINSPKHLGKCAFYAGVPDTLIHGMNLLNLRPIKEVTFPKYIYFYLNSHYFKRQIARISNQSVNQASFSSGNLKRLKIPLPPLSKQKKIAEILDAADSLRQKDRQLIEHYNTLSQSLFLDMFGDPVTNHMGWEETTFGNVSNKITDGTHQSPKFLSSGVPFLLVSNIVNNEIVYETKKFISEEEYKQLTKNTPIEVGDILYTSVGSYGNPAIVESDERFCFQRHIAQIKLNHEIVNVKYVREIMLTAFVKRQAERLARGVAQKTLNLKAIKSMTILVPPMKLQEEFASRIEQLELQKKQAKASLQKSEELFNSLLQRAFKGELTS